MSEKLAHQSEQLDFANPEQNLEPHHETQSDENIEQQRTLESNAREKLKELPASQPELALPIDESSQAKQPQYVDKLVQSITLKNELNNIRQRLPLSQKLFSKAIHQPVIRNVSELSAKSIARPSGLLGGGLCAFIGSLAYLLFAQYIGLTYNYLLAILFFVFGFVVGICIEFMVTRFKTDN